MESKVNSTLERWKILDLWHFVCRRFIFSFKSSRKFSKPTPGLRKTKTPLNA